MEDVRKSIAKLFGEPEMISLELLDKAYDDYISLDVLEKPPRREKCRHLSPLLNCNAGGSAHAGCTDESFHSHCRIKALAERKVKSHL